MGILDTCHTHEAMGKADKKKAAAAKKASKKSGPAADGAAAEEITVEQIKNLRVGDEITDEQQRVALDRAVTGVLASPVAQLDIKFRLVHRSGGWQHARRRVPP